MKTINMWLESPKKVGQIELTEDEITYNLEDFLNDLIYNGFDTFKLYSGVTNTGPIGLIAKVKNGEILEMDIDEYSQIIGEDLDIEDLYNDESDSWTVIDLNENTGDENSNYFKTENEAKREYDRLVNEYHKNEDALHTVILSHNGETIEKFNYEDTTIKDASTYDVDMAYAEKMVKVMLDKGMDKDTIIDVLVSSGLTEEHAKSLLPINAKDACKDTDDVFIKDDDYDKAQVKAYKMLIGPKKPFAVIYAYSQGKNKVLLNPPLIKKSKEEVQDFLNGFRRGKEGTKITADVFYASQIRSIKESLLSRGLIKDNTVKDSKIPEVDDWIIEEARKIVMSGYDDKEDLLDKIQDLSDDLTPRNVLDIYKYLKHTMKGVDSVRTRKYNRYCGQLVTDSLKDVDNNLRTGKSYFKKLRMLFRQYLGTDENYGDKWIQKDNGSVIDMYSWVEKQEPEEDYKKNPKKTLKLEQQQFENIIDDICAELGCSWERGYEGTSSGSSTWFHDATDLNNNKEYDDYCIADYRIILPEGITKWEKGNDKTEVSLMLTKDSKKVKDMYSYEELKKMYTGKQHNGTDIYKVDGKYSFNPNTHSDRFETEEDLINSTKTKWQPGDETVLKINTPEYRYMRDVVKKLNELAAPGYTYRMEDVYLDAGQDWVWTTIVQNGGWASTQILNPKQWLDIVNGKPTDEIVKDIRSGEYFHEE